MALGVAGAALTTAEEGAGLPGAGGGGAGVELLGVAGVGANVEAADVLGNGFALGSTMAEAGGGVPVKPAGFALEAARSSGVNPEPAEPPSSRGKISTI